MDTFHVTFTVKRIFEFVVSSFSQDGHRRCSNKLTIFSYNSYVSQGSIIYIVPCLHNETSICR